MIAPDQTSLTSDPRKNNMFSPRREDAKNTKGKNTKGMGRMTADEIGRQIVDIAVQIHKHGITRTVNRLPEESR